MSWYWIILIVVCYVLLSAVTCIVLSRVAKITDECITVLSGIFWPLVVILLPITMLMILLYEIVDRYGYKEETK